MSRWGSLVRDLAAAQKTSAGASLWSRFVNRPLGRLFAAGAVLLGASPNTVTAISAAVTASAVALLVFVTPHWWLGVLVALLFVLGFALDSADGQVARLTNASSPAGEWLDHVVDAGKMVAVHAAVLVGWYRFIPQPHGAWLVLPLWYAFVAVVLFAGGTLTPLLIQDRAALRHAPSLVRSLALLPADFGVLSLSFVAWGAPGVFRWVYLVLAVATTAIAVLLCIRWFRQLSGDRGPAQ